MSQEIKGCQYWVRHSTIMFQVKPGEPWLKSLPPGVKTAKTKGKPGLQCGKMVAEVTENYCPHHIEVLAWEAERPQRAAATRLSRVLRERFKEEQLKSSPLAIHTNPEEAHGFDYKK